MDPQTEPTLATSIFLRSQWTSFGARDRGRQKSSTRLESIADPFFPESQNHVKQN